MESIPNFNKSLAYKHFSLHRRSALAGYRTPMAQPWRDMVTFNEQLARWPLRKRNCEGDECNVSVVNCFEDLKYINGIDR